MAKLKDSMKTAGSCVLDCPGEIKENEKGTNIVRVNEEGTTLMQVRHELVNVGESIAQVKYNTSATVTDRGTVVVAQFKQEISSRDTEVWYYKNALGRFEGSLSEAQMAFPDVDFSDINIPNKIIAIDDSDLRPLPSKYPMGEGVVWETLNEFDAEKDNGGQPTNWSKWADATQTALDVIGLIPAVGEIADCLNGVISLARGNYADAALSFAAMIPFVGAAATTAKHLNKMEKASDKVEGVYDLIVKNADDIQGYVGQSNDTFKRVTKHFNPKRGKLKHTVAEQAPIVHKMPGSDKLEREIYEQFVILEKYGGDITKRGSKDFHFLLNKVNPVGGRFDVVTPAGRKVFKKEAEKIAEKYGLPTSF